MSADARSDASIDAATHCAVPGFHDFCADFDEGPLANGWDDAPSTTLLRLDTAAAVSPPSSLLLDAPEAGATRSPAPVLQKTITKAATKIEAAFSLQREMLAPAVPITVLSTSMTADGMDDFTVAIVLHDGAGSMTVHTAVTGGENRKRSFDFVAGSVSSFERLVVEIVLAPAPAKIILRGDGAILAAGELVSLGLSPPPAVRGLTARFGLVDEGSPPYPAWKVRFDDVTLDLH